MSSTVIIPDELIRNNAHARGAEGLRWLDRLPELVAEFGRRWSITVEPPFPSLSFNYAAPAVRADGTRAVLKLNFPGDREFISEAEALRAFGGRGMARLLEVVLDEGAMLLERLEPGKELHTLRNERREVSIAAATMKQLWRPPPPDHSFPTVAGWGKAFARHRAEHGGTSGPLPRAIFERGETLYHELDASAPERVLLHGDLHHGNILSAQREEWLAIDPKGIVGDPVSETWPFLNNLWEDLYAISEPGRILAARVALLAEELGVDRERVRLWGIAGCVLSAVWSAENNGTGWGGAIARAELLAGMNG
ncbi:MAG TPA: aminoglycoside phosphotransferase family protein [Chloroflexota bacterium]